jgi:hypothetical protein
MKTRCGLQVQMRVPELRGWESYGKKMLFEEGTRVGSFVSIVF